MTTLPSQRIGHGVSCLVCGDPITFHAEHDAHPPYVHMGCYVMGCRCKLSYDILVESFLSSSATKEAAI
jgi:hypothetical protein